MLHTHHMNIMVYNYFLGKFRFRLEKFLVFSQYIDRGVEISDLSTCPGASQIGNFTCPKKKSLAQTFFVELVLCLTYMLIYLVDLLII